jgi:endonuclease-3
MIRTTGFFRSKTKNLIGMATVLLERFDGVVPTALEDLVMLPGVGRKTGNVVRSVAFGLPGLPVDTHVTRLSGRLGLTKSTNPEQIERELNALIAPEDGGTLSLRLILHGRAVCVARTPRCGVCILADLCPSAPVFSAQAAARPARGRARASAARASAAPRKLQPPGGKLR